MIYLNLNTGFPTLKQLAKGWKWRTACRFWKYSEYLTNYFCYCWPKMRLTRRTDWGRGSWKGTSTLDRHKYIVLNQL